MKHWLRPFAVRMLLAVTAMMIVLWPLLELVWRGYEIKPFDPITGAHPEFVVALTLRHLGAIEGWTWRIFPAFPVVVVASIGSILIFLLLGRIAGVCGRFETRCRACGCVLHNLIEPACPACGERL